ncbi:flagellar hook-associated protein FlgL [Petroclostridium sp. X23]|uniref:flagellar hook-associated protein FlgL n=1 Tax=Petroclostridium sp. X23 TaxID=3045146 RepID=UPI0024ACFA9C|nr:flagellar hook-associated protein FlgL [Petroclostridium sp. X23]WHH61518.1 flagellar hook-associated protein FlgL [Petroclostridium sp. X23]
MRVTNNMLVRNMMINLNNNLGRMEKAQQQMSTGKKISRPSDDPIIASRALKFRTDVSEIEQFQKNTSDALSWTEVTESALSNLGDVIQRVRELTVKASNGVLSVDDTLKIKEEISQLKKSIVEIGNTAYAGRYVFAGFKTDEPPYKAEKITLPPALKSIAPIDLSGDETGSKFVLNVDGVETAITLTADYGTPADFIAALQPELDTAFGADKIKATVDTSGYLTFAAEAGTQEITIGPDTPPGINALNFMKIEEQSVVEAEMEKLSYKGKFSGIGGPVSGSVTDAMYEIFYNENMDKVYGQPELMMGKFEEFTAQAPDLYFDISLDGTVERISLTEGTHYDLDFMVTELNLQLDTAFGPDKVKASSENGRLKFTVLQGENIKVNNAGDFDVSSLGFSSGGKSSSGMLESSAFTSFTAAVPDLFFNITLDGGTPTTIKLQDGVTYKLPSQTPAAGENIINDVLIPQLNSTYPGVFTVTEGAGGTIQIQAAAGQEFTISDSKPDTLTTLGFTDGAQSTTNQKQEIVYEIGVGNNIKINVEGTDIFGQGTEGLFETFTKLEMALEGQTSYKTITDDSGTLVVTNYEFEIDDMLADLDKDMNRLLKVRADVGGRMNFIELTDNRLKDDNISFTGLMSKNEDADMAEVIIRLQMEESVYRASLSTGARVIQPTLVDFIK